MPTAIKREKAKQNDLEYMPYIAAKREWDERYGSHMKREKQWRTAFFCVLALAIVLAVGLVTLSKQTRVVPYIVGMDKVGQVFPIGDAKSTALNDERLKAAAIYDWIVNTRTVLIDAAAQHRNIDRVYALLQNQSSAATVVSDWFTKNSPFDRATRETVDVSVQSVQPESDKAIEVVWQETTRDLQGTVTDASLYRGIITYQMGTVSDEKQILLNPLGLYITSVSWSKVIQK